MSEPTTAEGRALLDQPEDVYPSAEDITAVEAAAAEAERARIRAAVEEIIAVLGPTPPDCGCEGCRVEMQMALDNARAVLAAIDAPDATPDRADRERLTGRTMSRASTNRVSSRKRGRAA